MNRIRSVDIFRLFSIFAVIIIHTTAFALAFKWNIYIADTYEIINQLARFAVPFFFVISGYFWGTKIRNGGDPIQYPIKIIKRLYVIFIAWSLIYVLPFHFSVFRTYGLLGLIKVAYWNLLSQIQHPIILFMQGTEVHLWYLVALVFSVAINAYFIYKKLPKILVMLSVVLYMAVVLSKAYSNTPFGIHIHFNTCNGPFFGTLLFTTGYFISGLKISNKWLSYGLLIFVFGCILHFSEIYMLSKLYDIKFDQDYVFGTYFMGVGIAMAALSDHSILQNESLSKISRMTLRIYAIQFVFLEMLDSIDIYTRSYIWQIVYPIIVLTLSIITIILMSKNHFLKKIVI